MVKFIHIFKQLATVMIQNVALTKDDTVKPEVLTEYSNHFVSVLVSRAKTTCKYHKNRTNFRVCPHFGPLHRSRGDAVLNVCLTRLFLID